MRPILFQWRGLTLWSYPALLYVGVVLGVVAGNVAAHAAGIDALGVFEATFLLLLPALVGARLLFVATHWREFRGDGRRIFARSDGGAAQYGALAMILPLSSPGDLVPGRIARRILGRGDLHDSRRRRFHAGRLLPERLLRRASRSSLGDPAPESRRRVGSPRAHAAARSAAGGAPSRRRGTRLAPPAVRGRRLPRRGGRVRGRPPRSRVVEGASAGVAPIDDSSCPFTRTRRDMRGRSGSPMAVTRH